MNLKSLLPIFVLIAPLSLAQATEVDLLTEIRDAITDDYDDLIDTTTYDHSWGEANLLSSLPRNQSAASSSLAQYWSGASSFGSIGMNNIQKAQTFIDILLAAPYLPFNGYVSTVSALSDPVYKTIAAAVAGKATDTEATQIKIATTLLLSNPVDAKIAKLFYEIHRTHAFARNCNSYWEGGATERPVPRFVVASNDSEAITRYDNDDLADCYLGICYFESSATTGQSVTPNRANGYTNVIGEAAAAQATLKSVNCNDYNVDPKAKSICELIKSRADILLDSNNQPGDAQAAEGYLSALANVDGSLLQPTQALLIWRYSQYLPGSTNNVSFKDIYTPTAAATPNCVTPTNSQYHECTPSAAPANDALDTFVNDMVGLTTVLPPIRPGLANLTTDAGTYMLVAGQYALFTQSSVSAYSKATLQGGTSLYTLTDTINSAKSLRGSITSTFNMQRNGILRDTMQGLLAKTSALDIISEVRTLNEQPKNFINTSGAVVSKTGGAILKNSSNWRLKESGTSNWLQSVSSMSNVSLLREQAVLLAEIKQMLYLQFKANQKQLLLQTLTATSQSVDDPSDVVTLAASAENFASGASISSLAPPEPPSQEDINQQIADATGGG